MLYIIHFLLLAADLPVPEAPLTPPPEAIPGYEGAFVKMLLTLVALVVGIFLTVWILRKMSQGRFGHGGSGKSIQIIDKKPLSQKTMLYVIEVDGKQTLIAESQLEIKSIMSFESLSQEKN
jgi:flagellar biogenesis protein FliO